MIFYKLEFKDSKVKEQYGNRVVFESYCFNAIARKKEQLEKLYVNKYKIISEVRIWIMI